MHTHSPFPIREDHGCQKKRRVLGLPGFVSLKPKHKYISRLVKSNKSLRNFDLDTFPINLEKHGSILT